MSKKLESVSSDKTNTESSTSPKVKSSDAGRNVAPKNRKTRNQSTWLVGSTLCLCIVLVAVSLGFCGLLWWQQKHMALVWQQSHSHLADQIKVQAQQQQHFMGQQIRTEEKIQQHLAMNGKYINNLRRVLELPQGRSEDNWKLSEIEYLLRSANTQLQVGKDVTGSIQLLKLANDIVAQIEQYDLYTVKKGIEEDLATINGLNTVNKTSVWLQLNAAIDQIGKLAILTPEGFSAHEEENKKETKDTADKASFKTVTEPRHTAILSPSYMQVLWNKVEGVFLDSWKFFSKQFYFRDHHKDQKLPLVSPKEEMFLRQNMQLMLAQAQQALLRDNEVIFKQCIQNALYWLNLYFHNNSPEAKALQSKLQHLYRTVHFTKVVHGVTHGLTALIAYKTQKEKTASPHGEPSSSPAKEKNKEKNREAHHVPKIDASPVKAQPAISNSAEKQKEETD